MKSIDEYILMAQSMQNTSDGGSAAYHFDDVVLVKYVMPTEYKEKARPMEEAVALEANKKREQGTRTPYHYAIKRTIEGDYDVCWVLQERAKGDCFSMYDSYHNDASTQLLRQETLAQMPEAHYEKCATDLCALMNMGLELKSKNIYYDKQAGFTFIDLLGSDGTSFNLDSIEGLLWIKNAMGFIGNISLISSYRDTATEEQKKQSEKLYNQIMHRSFTAMEKVVPNFSQNRRWILRTYSQDKLKVFESLGTVVGDLSLTEEEYAQFKSMIDLIVENLLQKVSVGEYELWQIETNEIRIALEQQGLRDAWMYHRSKTQVRSDFESDYQYEIDCFYGLIDIVKNLFYERLDAISKNMASPYLLEAKEELDKKRAQMESGQKNY